MRRVSRFVRPTSLISPAIGVLTTLICGTISASAIAGDYDQSRDRNSGFYAGVLGQYSYADAHFEWDGVSIFDRSSHNWGVSGVMGYGWKWGHFYFGPEAYVDYANISNVLAQTVDEVTSLALDRQVGAGLNLLAGVTAFDDRLLVYGLIGGGATDFSGRITTGEGSVTGNAWYPVLGLGGGIDWAVLDSVSLRLQAKHTIYYDASRYIFPSDTSQSYNFDTTSVSFGVLWRPWN